MMVGSLGVAAAAAQLALIALIVAGWMRGDLRTRGILIVLTLAAVAKFGLPRWWPAGEPLATTIIAAIDIALVFVVYRGDIRLT